MKYIKTFEYKAKSTDDFIKIVKGIHGDKYDYSKTDYKNTKTPITIICPIHGEFVQSPEKHQYQKSGCPICAGNLQDTTETFIEKAIHIHGDKYNYDKVDYVNGKSKVTITCLKHGDFLQRANNHLAGDGCPRCQESKGEKKVIQYLIKHNIEFEPQKKFPDCRLINPLPFDFYLPDYNMCIEYDGEQHFGQSKKFTSEQFEKTVFRDGIKNKYCEDKGIKLLRIKYTDYKIVDLILNDNI
jgi:very-short-patch-repair endonuclease